VQKQQDQKPILKLIERKVKEIDDHLGLHENQVAALRHLVISAFGVKSVNIDIHYTTTPKAIVLTVLDAEGKKLIFKPKKPELLNQMLAFLGIKEYQIYFWGNDVGN